MPSYRVTWEIDIEAETPEEAAWIARDYLLDDPTTSWHWDVIDSDGVVHGVEVPSPTRPK